MFINAIDFWLLIGALVFLSGALFVIVRDILILNNRVDEIIEFINILVGAFELDEEENEED